MPKYKMPDGEEIEAPDRCEVKGAHLDLCAKMLWLLRWSSDSDRLRVSVEQYSNSGRWSRDCPDDQWQRDVVAILKGRNHTMAFDFCPFCGASIRTAYQGDVPEREVRPEPPPAQTSLPMEG
jgi:hypothetical protein